LSNVIPSDFKDCAKFEFLTKEIVYAQIKQYEKERKSSHDYWHGDTRPFSNACNGYDANVIGDEYATVGKNTFKVVVYALYLNDEAEELEVDYNHVIFSFLIEGENTTYSFEEYADAKEFIDTMPELFTDWDSVSKVDLAKLILQCDTKRDILGEYDCDTWHIESNILELSYMLSQLVLKGEVECTTSLDALVALVENELHGITPSRDELHALVKKYCSPSDNLDAMVKSVECKIPFSMEAGVLVS